MAARREREQRAVLAESVAEMRRKGRPEFEMADLFMDFKGIQVTLAKMAQALIDGRIDCKTAGRLVVQLQMASKLLWMVEKTKTRFTAETRRRREELKAPQICAEERKLSTKISTTKNTKGHKEEKQMICIANHLSANQGKSPRIGPMAEVLAFADIRSLAHGPPTSVRAA